MLNGDAAVKGPVATANVAAFMTLATKLIERDPNVPGIGVFYGPSGYGKTYASIFAQNKTRALRVEVGDYWTRKTLLKAILAEAGQAARGTIADMADEAIRILGDMPSRPVIIDEADRLLKLGMIELVRDLHDKSTAPIILIGEELLPTKIEPLERVHNRVLDWVGAQPSDLDDARQLAGSICRGIKLSDDLLAAIVKESDGRARRIVVNLVKAGEMARNRGLKALDLKTWGQEALHSGRAPKPRGVR
ncbi:AAA family ATPase [Xanthobacter autotrophicus]|uniref:AAA family ATPase n=1 Tax=Xanthobacter autotrophicus TaxID=280 RepID=UPI00372CA70A